MKWTLLALTLVACGPASRNTGGGDDDNGPGVDGNNSNSDGCSDAAKLVYVVDENNTLSQFDPMAKSFHDLGQLNCSASFGASPFSMSVDRSANAWVLYSSGELFHLDTSSLVCTKVSLWNSPLGLFTFGMGFSTDSAGGSTDSLYVAGGAGIDLSSATLAKVDTTNVTATQVGTVAGSPELTGNGNAELWGFFPDQTSPHIDRINKTSGHSDMTYPLSSLAGNPSAWAFAFWGGDYWVFLMRDTDSATKVFQVDGTNGSIKSTTNTQTRTIVGAGVSTCAPVVIL